MTTEGGKIEFIEYHQPDLAEGDYALTIKQRIEAKQQLSNKQDFSEEFSTTLLFSVLGPRFTLDPQVVSSVFPPPGSVGDHSNVLPHIILNRSTLPWERVAVPIQKDDSDEVKKQKTIPWLVLLLFEEGELAAPQGAPEKSKETLQTFSVGDLKNSVTGTIKWPGITLESGQHDSDLLSVIDVPWRVLKQIIPTGDDLRFLSHVRKTQESTGKPGEDELAVILGARLPKPGGVSCVHLVSVERCYKEAGGQVVFDDRGAQDGDSIRLVSLKSWRFTCADPKSNFTGLLTKLGDHSDSLLRLPRLPEPTGADPSVVEANHYLAMGCVPLPHAMRQGNKTVSWYRGPLVPGSNTATKKFELPIRTADELVYYDDTYGMFDVSYAAAWELGRLLALQSKSVAVNLYRWKRSHIRKLKDAETQLTNLPFDGPTAALELPEIVSSWFENLILLEGVPFSYLVPDERMLPAESIRFFQVDPIWIECLVDGAFSIGRVLESDHKLDRLHKENNLGDVLPERSSGFLLRSEVVAGWPGLQVDGYDEPKRNDDFVLEKLFLFELDPADCVSDLNQKRIAAKLEGKFQGQFQLSKERCTVENREWLISNSEPQFKLIKRENNQIDVCFAADAKFLFSIDGGFETDLIADKSVSLDLQRVFDEQKHALLPDSAISVISWFITDDQHQKHYLIQTEEQLLKVYRDYKLPLLRMARLSANVLICLFEGIVQTVDLHLKPDTLHCGVDKPGGDQNSFSKKLKKLTETTASFITPAIGSNVTVSVQNSRWIAPGSTILIQGAGAYMVTSVTGTTSIDVQSLASTGNVLPNTPINAGADVRARDDTIHIPLRKLTETTASFIAPAIGSDVTVSVQNSQSIARGSTILIQGAGAYMVISVPSTTSIDVQNLGSTGNVPPNTPINARAHVRARVIDVGELAKKIQEKVPKAQSAAEFALEMIEGAEKVRFCSQPQ